MSPQRKYFISTLRIVNSLYLLSHCIFFIYVYVSTRVFTYISIRLLSACAQGHARCDEEVLEQCRMPFNSAFLISEPARRVSICGDLRNVPHCSRRSSERVRELLFAVDRARPIVSPATTTHRREIRVSPSIFFFSNHCARCARGVNTPLSTHAEILVRKSRARTRFFYVFSSMWIKHTHGFCARENTLCLCVTAIHFF